LDCLACPSPTPVVSAKRPPSFCVVPKPMRCWYLSTVYARVPPPPARPRSSLYGSDAIGGVIQIFTRRGDGTLTPTLSLSGGTYATWQGQAGLSGGNEHAWYSISAAGLHTDGFPACRGAGAPIFAGCFVYPPPGDDGYWNDSGSVRGGYRFDNGLELSGDWLRAFGDTQYDGDVVNSSKVVQQVLGGTVKLPTLGIWHSSLTGGQSQDDSNDYLNGVYVDTFDTHRD